MSLSFQGLDPLVALKAALGIPLGTIPDPHPALRMSGLFALRGSELDFATESLVNPPSPGRRAAVIMVGCGGTGSHLLPNILQYLGSKYPGNVNANVDIILVDGDVVEEKNLVRQRFSSQDLGQNKAQALARRYSDVFGIKIVAVDKYLTSPEDIPNILTSVRNIDEFDNSHRHWSVIILGAVDNHRARALIWNYYLSSYTPVAWIDAGNEAWHGQVIMGMRGYQRSPHSHFDWSKVSMGEKAHFFDLPCFFDVYPEEFLKIGGTSPTPQNECARIVGEDPQTIHANMWSAQCASSLFSQLFEGTIRTSALYFDAKSGQVRSNLLTKANITQGFIQQKTSRSRIFDFLVGLLVKNPLGAPLRIHALSNLFPGVFSQTNPGRTFSERFFITAE